MNLALCGMMGVGKSTVGRILAQRTGKTLVDTDEEIVRTHGAIANIFAEYGEAYFRALETETVRRLSGRDGLILSTGGGLVLKPENCQLLKRKGKIVYLSATLETLLSRVRVDMSRPLLQTGEVEERMKGLFAAREGIYRAVADLIVETDGKTAEEVADSILANWEE